MARSRAEKWPTMGEARHLAMGKLDMQVAALSDTGALYDENAQYKKLDPRPVKFLNDPRRGGEKSAEIEEKP